MPGIHNEHEFTFERDGETHFRTTNYFDNNKNRWSIDIDGPLEKVLKFVDERPFLLEAEPITDAQFQRSRERALENERQKQGQSSSALDTDQKSGLRVEIHLLALHVAAPFVVHTLIDLEPPFHQRFELQGDDMVINLKYTADGGTIKVEVKIPPMSVENTGSRGQLIMAAKQRNATFGVDVSKVTGEPKFSLEGDIDVAM